MAPLLPSNFVKTRDKYYGMLSGAQLTSMDDNNSVLAANPTNASSPEKKKYFGSRLLREMVEYLVL